MREFDITVNGKTYNVQVVEKTVSTVSKAIPVVSPISPVNTTKREVTPVPKTVVGSAGSVVSPMPGKVLSICVKVGDSVNKGDLLCIVEAMKMENEVHSPATGTVAEIFASEGNSVAVNDPILRIE